MNENDILVGWYALNGDIPCEVYANPDTREVYYVDEQNFPFLIMGLEHSGNDVGYEITTTEGFDGEVYDGKKKWAIKDGTAYLVDADATTIDDAEKSVSVDFDVEYEYEEQ